MTTCDDQQTPARTGAVPSTRPAAVSNLLAAARPLSPAPLRAWVVEPGPYSTLVFAPTPGKAKSLHLEGPYEWRADDYVVLRCRRAPRWDAFADESRVVETNADLPTDAPPFYDEAAFDPDGLAPGPRTMNDEFQAITRYAAYAARHRRRRTSQGTPE